MMRFQDGNFKKDNYNLKNPETPVIVRKNDDAKLLDSNTSVETMLLEFRSKIKQKLNDI